VHDSTDVELSARRFRALGDPIRLRVIQLLADGPRCVCELRDRLQVPGPLLSHHLGVLRDAGLVGATRRGRWIDYALVPEAFTELGEALPAAAVGAAR